MSKAKPFDDRVRRASYLAARARVNLDLFAFLMWQTNLDKFEDALIERWDLFEFIRTANEHEFLARIVNLFARRADTDNFPELVDEAERVDAIDAVMCATIRAQIAASDSAYKVAKLFGTRSSAIRMTSLPSPRFTNGRNLLCRCSSS